MTNPTKRIVGHHTTEWVWHNYVARMYFTREISAIWGVRGYWNPYGIDYFLYHNFGR